MIKMRATIKKLSLFTVLILCLFSVSCSGTGDTEDNTQNDTIKDIIYKSDGESVTVTGYSGRSTEIVFPSEIDGLPVTEIAPKAFYDFIYLEKVVIPDSVKKIDGAFEACPDLTEVELGSGVTSMNGAFLGCTNLKTVTGGQAVKHLDSAFSGCTSLTETTVYPEAVSASSAFLGCTALKTVTLNEGISFLDMTFSGCTALEEINIPQSVTELDGAFSGCTSLVKISGGENVRRYIDAFSGCTSLRSITLGAKVSELSSAFVGCSSLVSVVGVPDTLERYGASFAGCSSLTEIKTPDITDKDSLSQYVPSEDLKGCEGLTKVTILCEFPQKEDFCKTFAGLVGLREVFVTEANAESLLRVAYSYTDSLYEGSDKAVAKAVKNCKKGSGLRITAGYAVIFGKDYSHIYGGDVSSVNAEKEADAASITGFVPFEKSSYWCGFPTGGSRKNDTVAIERKYSFYLRVTGKSGGNLPAEITVNGMKCVIEG